MKNPSLSLLSLLALVAVMALPACDDTFSNDFPEPEPAEVEAVTFGGTGYGLECEVTEECRDGLACDTTTQPPTCLPMGDKGLNEKCLLTAECADKSAEHPHGLHCGWAGFCVPACVGCLAPGETAEDCDEGATGQDAMIAALGCSSGTGEVGSDCATSSECQRGLFCEMQGLSGFCTDAGERDLAADCEDTSDCRAGLRCSNETGKCEAGSLLLFPDLFGGVECTSEGMPFGVRTVVPGKDAQAQFFDFPYPSDVHLNDDGTVNLQHDNEDLWLNFPTPGAGLIGFDPIGKTVEALDDEITGWSLLSGVWFQFTGEVDPTSLVDGQTVHLVKLPEGTLHPINIEFDALRNKFACGNRVFLQPVLARPLDPNTTYAAIVTKGVTSVAADGQSTDSAQQLDDMAMLLSDAVPTGEADLKAWQSFAKLRAWLKSGNTSLTTDLIAGATVFTTGDPTSVVAEIYDLAQTAEAEPEIVWGPIACVADADGKMPASRCGTPLERAGEVIEEDKRGCPATESASYTEYHTLVKIPVIQQGTRPYVDDDGNEMSGDLSRGANGKITIDSYEEICVAISIPKDPAEQTGKGWPVLLYGHGTGGTHRQGIALLGDELGRVGDGTEPKDRFAVMAWDQPMHHLRRFPLDAGGKSLAVKDAAPSDDTFVLKPDYVTEYAKEPGPLFYNFQNPRAARANYLQATMDTFALVRLLREWNGNGWFDSPVQIDPDRIAYHGHSQGGGNGPMVGPFDQDIGLMILSGTGGSTVDGILGKKQPYDSSIGCRIMLQEIDVTRTHPGMHILQHYFDAIDPGIYGPLMKGTDMNFMQVVGVSDSFTPPVSMAAYAGSADTDLLMPQSSDMPSWADDMVDDLIDYATYSSDCPGGVSSCVLPNRPAANPTYTRVSIQHPPCAEDQGTVGSTDELTGDISVSQCAGGTSPGFDGHFVVYRNLDALAEMLSFINSWSLSGTAIVVPAGSNSN